MNIQDWLGADNTLGISIWENKYQYNDETFEEWLDRVSNGDEELKQLIVEKKFLFGGRILANRGLNKLGLKVTYSNCYVLSVDDSIESIYKTCSDLARTFSYGGGVGLDISKLRPIGSFVNNTARKTSGACSFMDTFSQVTETIGQNGRRGALMLSLDCTHPEVIDFINIKTDLERVTKANISVRVTDDFMKAVKNDEDWELYFKSEHEEITKIVKAKDVFKLLAKNNWNMAEPGILFWDRISNYNILSEDKEFEYAGVNPCAEEPLPNGGSCLLGALNLSAYVVNKEFDFDTFAQDVHIAVKGLNDVLDEGLPLHPLAIQRQTVHDYRQIGLGIMGVADMLIKMGIKYDSEDALDICDNIGVILANESLKASALLAEELGSYPKYNEDAILSSEFVLANTTIDVYDLIKKYGLRNSQLLTIAPTGSISTMIEVSGGAEPIFSFGYTRKTESLHGEDVYYKVYTKIVKDYMEENGLNDECELPNFFVNAQTINPFKRVEMQGVWQEHIDASISSTVNLPNETTVEQVEELYMYAWEVGCKGLTIFRDGCARCGVLTLGDKKEDKELEKNKELRRGEWEQKPKGVIEIQRKIYSGCGKELLHICISPKEKRIIEFYITSSSTGGCKMNINALAIAMSGMLRLGGSIDNIKCAFRGLGVCPSYNGARIRGKEVSKGVSCPTAILNALIEVEKQLKNETLIELVELGFYKNNVDNVNNIENNIKKEKKENKFIPIDLSNSKTKCPECGENLNFTGGCNFCPSCGFTKCD